eukprot:TRINITY_DN2146_c0_g1_i1.p1 TRINITY_DN2146_c0_g1~~TRINITY_DN2146_c0_g1_i1.p1  ORF type:complete len:102 (+),score=31.33 TRINITY_DN2146_c0_g1_i1:119-424(+)
MADIFAALQRGAFKFAKDTKRTFWPYFVGVGSVWLLFDYIGDHKKISQQAKDSSKFYQQYYKRIPYPELHGKPNHWPKSRADVELAHIDWGYKKGYLTPPQ